MPDNWFITFETVHFVMKAEKALRNKGIKVSVVPIPRRLSSDCGVALEASGDSKMIKNILENERILPEGIFPKNNANQHSGGN